MAIVAFLETHPDDFALAFAASGYEHIQSSVGHEVHVISIADGSGSGAQVATGLSTPEFIRARDDEMRRANRALGIRYEHMHTPVNRRPGGFVTPDYVAEVVRDFLALYPGAWIKAYSPLAVPGRHADHVATGKGVDLLHKQGVIDSPRYYIEPWLYDEYRAAHPHITLSPTRANGAGVSRIRAAFDEFTFVDRRAWKYGIGGLSVGNIFTELRPDPVNYWHMPVT